MEFQRHEDAVSLLPKLMVLSGGDEGSAPLREYITCLGPFPIEGLVLDPERRSTRTDQELWRAYSVLSFLAHAYIWCEHGKPAARTLPSALAVPWHAVATALGMPPILTHATYNLLNFARWDASGPLELGNLTCLNNFGGGTDEEWFRVVHIAIEAAAGPALGALHDVQNEDMDAPDLRDRLAAVGAALAEMTAILGRMECKCDPYIYHHRVRGPLRGWRNSPALPDGLLFEGVSANPQRAYGGSAAQSATFAALDAALGVRHGDEARLTTYLREMRAYMPPEHRAYIAQAERGLDVNALAQYGPLGVRQAYTECIRELSRFRSMHMGFAHGYVAKFSKEKDKGLGSGGLPFMKDLRHLLRNTQAHMLTREQR